MPRVLFRSTLRNMALRIPRAVLEHVPAGATITRVERMSPAFAKYHLDDGSILHRFTRGEPHADPHDHPFGHRAEGTGRELRRGGLQLRLVRSPAGEAWSRRSMDQCGRAHPPHRGAAAGRVLDYHSLRAVASAHPFLAGARRPRREPPVEQQALVSGKGLDGQRRWAAR